MPTAREKIRNQFAGMVHTIDTDSTTVMNAVRQMNYRRLVYVKAAADAMASTTTSAQFVARVPTGMTWRVVEAHFTSHTGGTITADATDTVTITVEKADGAGGSATAVAAWTSNVAGGSLAALVPKALTVTGSASTLTAGQILDFTIAKGGSGKVVPAGQLDVVVEEL